MKFVQTISGSTMRPDIVPTFDSPNSSPPLEAWQGIFEIKADPNIEGRVYTTAYGPNKGLYRSDDSGMTWTKLYTNDRMRGIAIAPNNSDIIYVSSSLSYHSGSYNAGSIGFLVSYDAGSTWAFANEGLSWPHGGRMEIESSGNDPHLWAWSPGLGIQHTPINVLADSDQDGIADIYDCYINESSSFNLAVNQNPILSDTYYADTALTSIGTVVSNNTISFIASHVIDLKVGFVAEAGSDFIAKIAACDPPASFQEVIVNSLVSPTIHQEIIADTKHNHQKMAMEIFPNPFKTTSTIHLKTNASSRVDLTLYNTEGKVVSKIVHQVQLEEGNHSFTIDRNNMDAGVYYVILNTEIENVVVKLVVVD